MSNIYSIKHECSELFLTQNVHLFGPDDKNVAQVQIFISNFYKLHAMNMPITV